MIILQQTRGLLSSNDQLSLDLQFAADKSFSVNPNSAAGFLINSRIGPSASFSRASSATEVGSNGLITFSKENLAWWSESLTTSTTWNTSNVTPIIDGVGPNNVTAFEIAETTATSQHWILNRGGSVTNSTPVQQSANYTASVFLKKISGSVDWVQLTLGTNGFSSTCYLNVNISSGTFGLSSGLASGVSPTITSFPNGWYRVAFTVTSLSSAASTNNLIVAFTNNTDVATRLPTYAGNTSNKILVTMAQFERGNAARDYILTTSSARYAPRFDHTSAGVCRGLLIEESRTNLCRYSGRLVIGTGWASSGTTSVEDGVGPDNDVAYEIAETSGGAVIHTMLNTGGTSATQATSITSGVVYTGSIFLKKIAGSVDWVQVALASAGFGTSQYVNINLSDGTIGNSSGGTARVESYANGWYRVSWTCTATVTTTTSGTLVVAGINNTNGTTRTPSYAGNIANKFLAAAAQFEVGSSTTSYIPTTTSSGVRSADVCNITGTNFSGFYNNSEGTLVSNAYSNALSPTTQNPVVSIESGTSQILRIRHIAATNRLSVIVSGVSSSPSSGYDALNTLYKVALAASSTGADYAINGTQIADTFAGSSLTADNMKLSVSAAGLSNTTLESIRYYRKRHALPKLLALTV